MFRRISQKPKAIRPKTPNKPFAHPCNPNCAPQRIKLQENLHAIAPALSNDQTYMGFTLGFFVIYSIECCGVDLRIWLRCPHRCKVLSILLSDKCRFERGLPSMISPS